MELKMSRTHYYKKKLGARHKISSEIQIILNYLQEPQNPHTILEKPIIFCMQNNNKNKKDDINLSTIFWLVLYGK